MDFFNERLQICRFDHFFDTFMRLATLQIKSINEIYSVAHTHSHTQTRRSLDVQRLFSASFFRLQLNYFSSRLCEYTVIHHSTASDVIILSFFPTGIFFFFRSAVRFNCPIQYADRNFSLIETSTKSQKSWTKKKYHNCNSAMRLDCDAHTDRLNWICYF